MTVQRTPGFTDAVRQELALLPHGSPAEMEAELAALLRVGGSLHLRGGRAADERWSLSLTTTSGAVARRVYALLQERFGVRAELTVQAPSGVRHRTRYGVSLGATTGPVARRLGLLDATDRPLDGLAPGLDGPRATAYVRGAVLAGGSFSRPGRPPHLEIPVSGQRLAEELAALVGRLVSGAASVTGGDRPRVVLKSGERIGVLLTAIGATNAFLRWDEHRLRRQLRSDATRLANADTANLRRTIDAAASQVAAVEQVVAAHGWDALDPELRVVALARLANPGATLAELGGLVDPPLSRSAVHRRLRRIVELARRPAEPGTAEPSGESAP